MQTVYAAHILATWALLTLTWQKEDQKPFSKITQAVAEMSERSLYLCPPREKLRIGGNQLMELKGALDRCVETMGQHISFAM